MNFSAKLYKIWLWLITYDITVSQFRILQKQIKHTPASYHEFFCREYTLHKTICKDYTQEILSTKIRGRAITATSRQVAHCSIQKENFYAYQLKRDNWIKSTKYNKRICLSTIPFLLWFAFLCLEININAPSSWFALYQHLEIYFFSCFSLEFQLSNRGIFWR